MAYILELEWKQVCLMIECNPADWVPGGPYALAQWLTKLTDHPTSFWDETPITFDYYEDLRWKVECEDENDAMLFKLRWL